MISNDNIVKLVLDIGNYEIKAILGEMTPDFEKMWILNYSSVPSKGFTKSFIENPEELKKSILSVLNLMRKSTGYIPEKVSIGIGGSKIISQTFPVEHTFEEKKITKEDVENLFKKAQDEIPKDKFKILKREMYNIKVNRSGIVKNPLGMEGTKLKGDVCLIYVEEEEIDNLVGIVNKAGLEVENMFLNSYASAKSTVENTEFSSKGVALIDIGEGSTDIILFKNDKIIYTKSLDLGGMHFVKDLQILFECSHEKALSMWKKMLLNTNLNKNTNSYNFTEKKKNGTIDANDVINARMDDIVNFIKLTIEESGFIGYLGKGIVLTGGLATLDGLIYKIHTKTSYLAKTLKPIKIRGLEKPDFKMATVIGLFLEAMQNEAIRIEQARKEFKRNKRDMQSRSSEDSNLDDYDGDVIEEKDNANKNWWKKLVSYFF